MRNLSNPINNGIETKQIKLQVEYKGVDLIALRILLVLPAKMTIKNNEIIIPKYQRSFLFFQESK